MAISAAKLGANRD